MPLHSMNRLTWTCALLVGTTFEQSIWIARVAAQENVQKSQSALQTGALPPKTTARKVIDRSTFSNSQWERLVNATAAALDVSGRSPDPEVTSRLLLYAPDRRAQAFEAFVDELLRSDLYSQWRAQTWINDTMSKAAMDRGLHVSWSLDSYRT